MEFPAPTEEANKFDVVCLSLVLNFEGDLSKRGGSFSYGNCEHVADAIA